MSNYQLANDSVDSIPITGLDAAGDMVALPAGVAPTLKNADPVSLNAVIDATGANLVLNALVPGPMTGISVEVDDGSLKPFTLLVDIVADVTPTSVGLNLSAVTHASQPVPVAAIVPPSPPVVGP